MKNVTYINASAGSGKTYTLTHKLAELVKSGKVRPDQVIMTTFTVKAANEMKEEAKKVLYENGLFDEAAQLDQAMIGTIHSVANSLIKKYWFFLGLSPDMGVLAEEDKAFYISQSLSELPDPDELRQLHAFCECFDIQHGYDYGKKGGNAPRGLNYDFWRDDIRNVITYTVNYSIDDYNRSIDESLNYIRKFVNPTAKLDFTTDDLNKIIDEHILLAQSKDESKEKLKVLQELNRLKRGVMNPTVAWYRDLAKVLNKWKKCGPLAENMRDHLTSLWNSPRVYVEQERYIRLLLKLAERWRQRFTDFKKERNILDYNDMENYLYDLVSRDDVADEIAMNYHFLFVDEYQDCSPIQVKIFDRLSDLMEHSYWVGDYKQAIYGFRGSDITLTKAVVDRISTRSDGCNTDRLDTSYRSLPDIVKLCNKSFCSTFKGILDRELVELNEHRTNDGKKSSLLYWDLRDSTQPDIADHIAWLVYKGVKPDDIAVLGRTNATLNNIATQLSSRYSIPASREAVRLSEMRASNLVMALLALVSSENDSLAKSQIAFLTEDGFTTGRIIGDKLQHDSAPSPRKSSDFLSDARLVRRFMEVRPTLRQQSIASLVETLIVELDLYNEVKKLGSVSESLSCLDTFIRTAKAYEQHCLQMNLSATVDGFMAYIRDLDPVGVGDAYGVQFFTYHSSKGLQWKYVILTQLDERKKDRTKCVKQNIYGIHFNYVEPPSETTPYPEVYIRVMPFVYGSSNTNVPADIQSSIEDTTLFGQVFQDSLSEDNRLLYVGMTRPRDVLILALEQPSRNSKSHSLQWFEDLGLSCNLPSDTTHPSPDIDLLGVGCTFRDGTLTPKQTEELAEFHYISDGEEMKTCRIPYLCDIELTKGLVSAEKKYHTPSSMHMKAQLKSYFEICKPMPHGKLPYGKTMADVGDCVHQIFCSIDTLTALHSPFSVLIGSYGLGDFLTHPDAIRKAWDALVAWLAANYGNATVIMHERPFTHFKDDCVYTGSIDLVWQTPKGDVLVDFKTCPMGPEQIVDENSEHFAGLYAGQLQTYSEALASAGEIVLCRLLYYPLSGLICEL